MSNKISDLVYKTVMGQLSDINEKNNRLLIELLEVKIKIPLLLEENNTHMEPCAEEEYNINIMSETTQLDEYKYISSLITKLENKIKFFNKEQKTLQDLFDKRQLEESELENELFFSNNSDDESDDKSDDKSGDKSGDKSDNKSGDKFNSDNIEDSDSDNIEDSDSDNIEDYDPEQHFLENHEYFSEMLDYNDNDNDDHSDEDEYNIIRNINDSLIFSDRETIEIDPHLLDTPD